MLKSYRFLDRVHGLKRRLTGRPGEGSGVLLLSSGGLGDLVLFALVLPRLAALARYGETVTVLIRRDARKMAFLFPKGVAVKAVDFARLRATPAYRWGVLDDLYRSNFRLVVSCDFLRHPDLDEALVAACAAAETVAMEPRSWPKYEPRLKRNRALYARLWDSGAVHQDKVVRWARFTDWLTGGEAPPPLVRLAPEVLEPAAALAQPTVVIQPFSALKRKQSPAALYQRIIDALPEGFRVVVTGAPGDMDRNSEYKALIERAGVTFDPSTFEDLVPLLRAARLVVSVDTALMHLAVAVGAPTLCLASAAYVGEIVPYAAAITPTNVHFAYQTMPCEGCLADCHLPAEEGMFPCVARLNGDAVLEKVRELIAD